MKYKWKEKELQEKLDLAVIHNDILNKLNYLGMIKLLHGEVDFELLNVAPDVEHESFMTRKNRFHENIDYLEDGLVEFIQSIFSIEKDEDNLFTDFQFKEFNLSNKDLVDLGYEILETLNNKHILQIYREITNPDNHYLNIMDFNDFLVGATKEIGGLTIPDKKIHKSYVTIHRHHDVDDVKALVHEAMHAYFFKKYKSSPYVIRYFDELEGRFGNRLAANYLLEHDMTTHGNELRASELYSILNESYCIYLNNCLYATAAKYYFRLKDATKELRKHTNFKESSIRESDLSYICSINCFDSTTEIINYLICLEAQLQSDKSEDQLYLIEEIRKHDGSYNFYNYELPDSMDFYKDKCKSLKRYKKECDQYIKGK